MTPLAIAVVVSLVFSVAFVAGAAWATDGARRGAAREAAVAVEGEAVAQALAGDEHLAGVLRWVACRLRARGTGASRGAWRGET